MITFEEIGIEERLIKAVTDLGYVNPTPIQEKAIPVLLGGTTDFIGLAQTGTGKTAAFGLPLLDLIDLIERKAINLEQIKYVVLDEADEMLNMGFQDDIEFILQNTPKRESTWLFSATMPAEIRRVSKKYMKSPVEVTVGKMNTANK